MSALVAPAALAVLAVAFVDLWFASWEPILDDLGLFNPIYTYLKTGHMTYPVYGMYDVMLVHPPTHYLVVATVMRLTGLPVDAAVLLPVLLGLVLAVGFTTFSAFSLPVKFGFLFGGFAGLVIWAFPSYVRPDVHQAAMWLAGLVALETGRLANWDWRRLGVGSLLIALSTALHYPASASLVAVAVYAAWVIRAVGWRRSRPQLVALALGSAVVLVPYAALFVLPHAREIYSFTTLANERGGGGILAGFDQARDQYRLFVGDAPLGGPFLAALAYPFARFGVPVVFVTTPFLALRRETRGIALASAPYLLFLLFYARGKSIYYYTAEFTLYFACLLIAALWAVDAGFRAVNRLARYRSVAVAALGSIAVAVMLFVEPATVRQGARDWHPLHREADVARAVGDALLPPNALLATNDIGLWYTTGAERVHYLLDDLDQVRDLSQVNLRAYLHEFDAVAVESFDSWATFNRQGEAIPEWYADRLLHIRGFYFGDRRSRYATLIRYLLLSARSGPIRGYAFRGRTIYAFSERASGTHVFVAAICPKNSIPATQYFLPWQTFIPLPGTTYPTARSTRTLVVYLDTASHYERALKPLVEASCRVRVQTRLSITREPVSAFLDRHNRRIARPIAFLRQIPGAERLFAPDRVRVAEKLSLAPVEVASASTVSRRTSTLVRVSTGSQQFAQVLTRQLPAPRGLRWLRARMRVLEGAVGICVLDVGKGCLLRRTILPTQSFEWRYLPLPPAGAGFRFYVDNGRNDRSTLELTALEVVNGRLVKAADSARSARRPGS